MEVGSEWVLEKEIGAGGFGLVRLFCNKVTRGKLVVKECRSFLATEDTLDRWQQELEILKSLDHPNVVHALDLPPGLRLPYDSPAPLICLEYCEMGDLRGVLKNVENCCGLPEEHVRQICRDINNGIRFLHSRHIIHRDLKPENVLIKRIGAERVVYKLTDFGYAKVCGQNSNCSSIVGTTQYVAPEVIRGAMYNSSVDFWSFGMVVFECITGKRPFLQGNNTVLGWMDAVAKKKPDEIWLPMAIGGSLPDATKLPQPNQLYSLFSDLITSWLKMALQHDPEMRKRAWPSDIFCSELMERILSTKVVNCVCMTTGMECSFEVKDDMRVSSLQEAIEKSMLVSATEQFLLCSDGRHVAPNDLVTTYFERDSAVCTLYLFTCSADPSFKLIPHRTPAINTLVQHQDGGIPNESRKDIYAHVFFHLREQMLFFNKLCNGHATVLRLLEDKCVQLKARHISLINSWQRTIAVAEFVKEMHCQDCKYLEDMKLKGTVPELKSAIGRTLLGWTSSEEQLNLMIKNLDKQQLTIKQLDVSREIQDQITSLKLSREDVCDGVKQFRTFVDSARDFYSNVKRTNNSGGGRGGGGGGGGMAANGMCDHFLAAIFAAQQLVENKLNGRNYCIAWRDTVSCSVAMETQLQELESTHQAIKTLNQNRQDNIWKLLSHERKVTPFTHSPASSPVSSAEYVNPANSLPARFQSQLSQASSEGRDPVMRWSSSKSSSAELSQSSIDQSVLCGILEQDPADSDSEIEKNKVLLKRLHSLIDGHSLRSQKSMPKEMQ